MMGTWKISMIIAADGKHSVTANDMSDNIELGTGGYELTVTRKTDTEVLFQTLGSQECLHYYHQKPRPSPAGDIALAISLASTYVTPCTQIWGWQQCNQKATCSKIGMKSNMSEIFHSFFHISPVSWLLNRNNRSLHLVEQCVAKAVYGW